MSVLWFCIGLCAGAIIGGLAIDRVAASKMYEALSKIIELQTMCKQLEERYGSDGDNHKLPAGAEQERAD